MTDRLDEALIAALRAANADEQFKIIADFLAGVSDVCGVVLAMLVGRGLIEPQCVESCLAQAAETWREKAPVRSMAIECERAAIAKIGKELIALRPLAGRVAGRA